jgi:hypothetical protein
MIPLFAVVRISTRKYPSRGNGLRLWIPLFLIWLLLLPLVLVLSPLAILALLVLRVHPFRAFAVFWQTLTGLTGTHIEVSAPDALVYVRIF